MRKKQSKTLMKIYDEDLYRLSMRIGKDRSASTLASLSQGRRYASLFLENVYNKEDIPLEKITPRMINDFSAYLSSERQLSGGTVWLACQQLKGVVSRAHQRGDVSWNPFAGFRIAKNIRPREYLSEDELITLVTHEFKKETLSYARDIFVFAAMTGLSFIDIRELTASDIVHIGDATWIISKRHKTKVPFQVRLFDIPLTIIRKYQTNGKKKIFGELEYRVLAYKIKEVMKEIGIPRHVTMHCARHSFAVLAINKGMPIESLSRILGHTKISTTQIYARITLQKLDKDMTELEKQLYLINNCKK